MEWIGLTIFWYSILFLIGVVFAPTARFLFPKSPDRGYPFAKTIGIIVITYAMFLFGVLQVATFTTLTLYFLLTLAAIGNYFIFKRTRNNPAYKLQTTNYKLIVLEEGLFLAALIALAYMRGQEPSIHGLEKFMDYGFMQSILRSAHFPPADMWYTPLPINYYYFGHMSGAILIKLTNIAHGVGYNLILATIFAQGITLAFSLAVMIVSRTHKLLFNTVLPFSKTLVFGLLGAVLVNTVGNLHTIYLFTRGYPNDTPVPFWGIMSWYNPEKYWYPNATRFIPFTIHEFPSYSYVVADLHGHVFDIPFVLLTLALVYTFFMNMKESVRMKNETKYTILNSIMFGFLLAVHFMTNAFDGPIYFLLLLGIYFLLFKVSKRFFTAVAATGISFYVFSLPFSLFFKPFASGIGVNCTPDFLVKAFEVKNNPALSKLGPFLFEKGNCQISPPWMMFVLWGFYLVSLLIFLYLLMKPNRRIVSIGFGLAGLFVLLIPVLLHFILPNALFLSSYQEFVLMGVAISVGYLVLRRLLRTQAEKTDTYADLVPLLFFFLGFFMILIPEFFYVKDIYPQHFRANTLFKLGYQAFTMMGIASTYVFYRVSLIAQRKRYVLKGIFLFFFVFVFIYPFYSVPSYYGKMNKMPQLDGERWIVDIYPQDSEIIKYLNTRVNGQPVVLEAQGDSYTDYERISAFTGLPTVAGWWVHEWLWRGNANIVGDRIPEINDLYQSENLELTRALIDKYKIKYVVVSSLEREKYKDLFEKKFEQIGKKIFVSSNGVGALYQVN